MDNREAEVGGIARETRIVNVRKRYSEFLGFKIRVRPKSRKYIVQSHICDKKLELERQKLVEQAKRIARPQREKDLWTKYGCTIQWFWEYRIIFNLPPASALIAGKSTDRS